jgi:hypothetical protein
MVLSSVKLALASKSINGQAKSKERYQEHPTSRH